MIACLSIPGFELKAALRKSPSLALRPAALAPEAGGEPLLGPVTAAAEAAGVRPRMRLGEALATMPRLVLVEPDPAAAEQAWEEIVCALEDAGFAVDPAARGIAYFETRGVERLYGGLEPALRRALASVGPAWDARLGAAGRRFTALAAASVARPGQVLVVRDEDVGRFLAPLPLTLLPLERQRYEELESLGVRRLGQLAGLPGGAVAERLGPDGRRAWSLARGGERRRVRGRRPPAEFVERLEFITSTGFLGGADARKRSGLRGKGPSAVITDLGILTPDEATKELTLTSIHPGVTVEQARAATGWPLKVSDVLQTTRAPEAGELSALRELLRRTAEKHGRGEADHG